MGFTGRHSRTGSDCGTFRYATENKWNSARHRTHQARPGQRFRAL